MTSDKLHQISMMQALRNLIDMNTAESAPIPTTIRDDNGVYQTGQESALRSASVPISSYDPYRMNEPETQNPDDIQMERQNLQGQNAAIDAQNKLDLYKKFGLTE